MSVDEELIARFHGSQVDGPVPTTLRHRNGEAIPCESAVVFIALLAPSFFGAEQRPLRIVEIRVGPGGIVSGMKAPEAVEGGDGFAPGLQVEGLSVEARGRAD